MSWLSSIIRGEKSPSEVYNEQIKNPVSNAWDELEEGWNRNVKDTVGDAYDDLRRSRFGDFWNKHIGKHGLASEEHWKKAWDKHIGKHGLLSDEHWKKAWDKHIGKHGIFGWIDDKWIEPVESWFNPDLPTPEQIRAKRRTSDMDWRLMYDPENYGYEGRKSAQAPTSAPVSRQGGFDEVDVFEYLTVDE
tara:strand:- start:1139 stop:1708 length:570 start_codon:yes stop_codon:yes gene_type:complete